MLIRSRRCKIAAAEDPDANGKAHQRGQPSRSTRNILLQPEGGVNLSAVSVLQSMGRYLLEAYPEPAPWAFAAERSLLPQTDCQHSTSALYLRAALMSTPNSKEI
jgi:hypothetical protein